MWACFTADQLHKSVLQTHVWKNTPQSLMAKCCYSSHKLTQNLTGSKNSLSLIPSPRSLKSSRAGAAPCVLDSHAKTPPGLTQIPCPSTPAPTWSPKAASGPKLCLKSSPTRETLSTSGWTRKDGCFTGSTTWAPSYFSAACTSPSLCGRW